MISSLRVLFYRRFSVEARAGWCSAPRELLELSPSPMYVHWQSWHLTIPVLYWSCGLSFGFLKSERSAWFERRTNVDQPCPRHSKCSACTHRILVWTTHWSFMPSFSSRFSARHFRKSLFGYLLVLRSLVTRASSALLKFGFDGKTLVLLSSVITAASLCWRGLCELESRAGPHKGIVNCLTSGT